MAVQDAGQGGTGNAQLAGSFGDAYAIQSVLQHFAGLCRVVHAAHGVLLIVVLIIN